MGLQTDAADLPETRRKITEPLSGTVWLTTCILVAGVVIPLLVAGLQHSRIGMFGFGLSRACATAPPNGPLPNFSQSPAQLRPGMSSSAGTVGLCAAHPTLGQRFLVTLTQAPTTLLWLAVLVLLWLLVRAVRRSGPFDISVTRRLRFLAWFVLAASLAVNAIQSYAAAVFTATAYPKPAAHPNPLAPRPWARSRW